MPVTLQQLRDLMAVVEAGSFRAAAERLNRYQSSLSRSILEFEASMDAKFFDRNPTGARLTPLGARLVPDIRAILDSVEEFLSRVREESGFQSDQFALGLDSALPIAFSQPFMAALGNRFRELHITLVQRKADEVLEAVIEGKIALGLVRDLELPPIISFRRFLVGELLVALPSDWRFDGETIEPRLVVDQRLHLAKGDITTGGIAKLREILGSKAKLTVHDCNVGWLIGLVASGMGIGLLTSVPAEAAEMSIRVVPARPTVPVVGITAIWLADSVPAQMNMFLSQFDFPGAPSPGSSSPKRTPALPNSGDPGAG